MKIYVGGIPFSFGDRELREVFEPFGRVESANVVSDRHSGRSRGFGFVQMPNEEEAKSAVSQLNGKEVGGRTIKVEPSQVHA